MGLAYQYQAEISGKGAKTINRLLIKWQHIDASGYQTDQLTLVVAAPDLDSLPQEGEQIGFSWGPVVNGQPQLVDKGKFNITRLTPSLWPHQVTIIATAAPFQVNDQTEFKQRHSQTWSSTTVGAIFRELVNRHGLSPRISPAIDSIAIDHIDQTDETDMAFLTRVARKYDAVAKPIDTLYVMAKRGQLKSITGKDIKPVLFSVPVNNQPTGANFINASVEFESRKKVKGVWAVWVDTSTGDEHKVTVGEFPFKRLSQRFESELLAKQQCESELKNVDRTGDAVLLDVPANPFLAAEGIVKLDSSFPAYMVGEWSIDKVTTDGTVKNGVRSTINATKPQR